MLFQEQTLNVFNHHSYSIDGVFLYRNLHELDSHFIEVFSRASTLKEHGIMTVKIEVSFIVSRAKQSMASFMHQLADHNLKYLDHEVHVEWRFESDDEDIEELGEIFQSVWSSKGLRDRFRMVALL